MHIRLKQSKTQRRVTVPVSEPLKRALDAAKGARAPAVTILVNSEGKPWTADGFRSSWRKACAKAGVVGVTFHDLRGTTVTDWHSAAARSPKSPPSGFAPDRRSFITPRDATSTLNPAAPGLRLEWQPPAR